MTAGTHVTQPARTTPRLHVTKATVAHSERDFTLMSFKDVFVVIFHHDTTVGGATTLRNRYATFAAQHAAGAGLLTIVEPGAPMPNSEAREALAKFMTENSDSILVSGVAYEGSGFRAAAVRSVVTGLTMLARQPFPHKVFATIDDASEWMITKMRGGGLVASEVRELIEAVSAARAELPETSADN